MSEDTFYITAAIDYANGPPHMGHAIEKIGIDAMARYRRLTGRQVHFLLGMDEHGLKVQQSAEAEGISPQQWVDRIAERFQAAWQSLDISSDDFIRTTQPRHRRAVEEMVRRMEAAGDFYRGSYEGYYCVGCEAFKREDELVRDAGDELRCPVHPSRTVQWTREENWFFRLSKYQDRLLALLDERPEFLQPESRANEIRRVIEAGLEDISVSRARLPWGIPWPGDPEHTVYVWIDALTNYLAAAGFPDDEYRRLWPADYHVIGKDITRFHCVYWPAMLMSADVELPRSVWAHGFVTIAGGKLSKSEGGVRYELEDMIARHGPDAFRYYLLREIPWSGDGEFSLERFDERYVSELANNVGNLANRTLSMIERYRDGIVPAGGVAAMDAQIAATLGRYRAVMDANLLHQGVAAAMELAAFANGFVEARAPWTQAKAAGQEGLDDTLGALARAVATLATLLFPIMPGKMAQLAERTGLEAPASLEALPALDLAGRKAHRGAVLFPRPE